MKLTRVGLENAGSVRSLVINDLAAGLNLVLGEIGSGKSTLRRGIGSLLYGQQLAEVWSEWAGSFPTGGEMELLIDGVPFRIRRDGDGAAAIADSLVATSGGTSRSLRQQLGEWSAADYATFCNLSFVDAPDIERRMVRRLLDRFGVAGGTAAWTTEAEYRNWRNEATQRREQLALDTTHGQRLIGRRERLQAELAEAETQHRSRLIELEQRRDRARAELTTLEQERLALTKRLPVLERDLRRWDEQTWRVTAPQSRGTTDRLPADLLPGLYRKLDRLQAEIRRTLVVKRDLQRRRQALAQIRSRLTEQDDCPDDWQSREVRRRLATLVQRLQHWANDRGDAGRWEQLTDWTTSEFHATAVGGGEAPPHDWTWPVDEAFVPLEAEEIHHHERAFPPEPEQVWPSIRAELAALQAAISRQATTNRRNRLQAEDRDLRLCQVELQRRLRWLDRRREARLTLLHRWDPAGYHLLRHGEQRFLDYARQQGFWAARCYFSNDIPVSPPVDPPHSLDPQRADQIRDGQAEIRRLQARIAELDRALADTRAQGDSLADQYRRLRDGLPVEALRKELQDIQSEIDAREPGVRRLRDAVQRDEPLWQLKYDGLIEAASRWCRQLTTGRVSRIALDSQELRLMAVDAAAATRPFHSLSRAHQDLVCLSVCLAVAQQLAERGTPMPLVFDDLFANLDVQLSQTVVDTLWDFVNQGHQVLLLAAERQVPQRWLGRPLSASEHARLAVYQLPPLAAIQQRTQWPLVLNPLVLSPATPVRENIEPTPSLNRWPQITEQTPLAHLNLIEPEWLLVFSKHRILLVSDLLELLPEELPAALRTHGLTMGQVDRWQSQAWLLCCIPGLRPYDVRLLVGSGITEPEQLEDLSAGDVLRKLEIYLATEEGQRVMQTGTAEEQARLHGWMNGLRDNRQTWGARPAAHSSGTRRQRWQAARRTRRPEPAVTMRIHESTSSPDDAETAAPTRLKFYLNLGDPVENAPSIGPRMAERFAEIGISSVREFLEAKPEELVRKLKLRRLDQRTLQDWQHQARLVCRIPNLRGHDAQLLVACEIADPESLLRHSAKELLAKVSPFANSKEGQRILRSSPPPDLAEIQDWLDWAKQHRPLQVA
jgi:predicted nuclease with TOPRIM domain